MLNKLNKADIFFLIYILISSLIMIYSLWGESELLYLLLVRFGILIVIAGILISHNKLKTSFTALIAKAYPLILSAYFYQETVNYNKLFFDNLDSLLEKADFFLFGFQAAETFSQILPNHFFSELMYIAYFSFYLLIIGFFIINYQEKSMGENIFHLIASLYLFYLIFSFIPAAGPQYYFPYPQNALPEAFVFDDIMKIIQEFGEQPTGAFPSSHVGISIIILILLRENSGKYFKIGLPIVFLLILSTVYIKAHYVVDVIGGLLFAPFILLISRKLYVSLPGK
ncbi:MAG: phosphoesterase [Marinilabiliales bacterium]|nr:MAG: phosphoesterase [Marinilabiliales bacterium]